MVMGVAGAPGESSSVTSVAKMQHKFAVRKASHLAPHPPSSGLTYSEETAAVASCVPVALKVCLGGLRANSMHSASEPSAGS